MRGQRHRGAARRFFTRKSRNLSWGLGLLALILIVVWVGPVLLRIDPIQQEINERLLPPGGSHILGTDNFGRDLASRILHAGRLDVQFAIVSTAITLVVGVAVGAIAGFYGGWIDALFMRLVDIAVAFPKLVLVIAIVSILGTGLLNMYLTIVLVSWYSYARVIRGEVLLAKNMEYVEAARCVGANSGHIIWRHVLPNVISPAVVYAAADAVQNILFAASLGYLGLGIQPPTPEWGTMVAEARGFMLTNPQLTIYPGLAIVVTGIAFSLIGDGLTDALRPGE